MEAVGAAASILAIAGAGIQISLRLIAFADQVGTAPQRIQDIGTDVSVTAGTLQELGELMSKEMHTERSARMFHPYQVQNITASSTRCNEIFDELKDILGKASQQLRGIYKSTTKSQSGSSKIKLSKMERMRWPFLRPSMESLLSELRDAKGTLTLILQVVHLRHAHTTASLDREEQNDLIRMIAAMRRQQLASAYGDGGGYKDLDASDTEDSDSKDPSEVRIVLEAWSVTPNTVSDEAFQHFLTTPIPISQQQIAQELKVSPQDFCEIASMIDSLSLPERHAILGKVLRVTDDSNIRFISSQSWTGSHDLFGKVTSRKFRLIVERRARISDSSRTDMEYRSRVTFHRQRDEAQGMHHDHSPPLYDSLPDFDGTHETEAYTNGRRRPGRAPPMPSFERRRPLKGDDWEQDQDVNGKRRKERRRSRRAKVEKEEVGNQHRWEFNWTEPQPASEPSDDDLVKSLMAQYTNFELGEPLVQVFATPQPTHDEAFIIPKRVPRPY